MIEPHCRLEAMRHRIDDAESDEVLPNLEVMPLKEGSDRGND